MEENKARRAADVEERSRKFRESQRAEQARSAARGNPFGGSPFGSRGGGFSFGFGGSPFGSRSGGSPFGRSGGGGRGPTFIHIIGPDGRPAIFVIDDDDDDFRDYFEDDDHHHRDFEDDDGPTREEHAEVLGISVDASMKEIKTTYRKMALKYHPDKYQAEKTGNMTKEEAEEHFKKCSAAYEYFMERNED